MDEKHKEPDALAKRLKKARIDQGLTINKLSAESGIAKSVIAKYESGNGGISVSTLKKLASALGLSVILI